MRLSPVRKALKVLYPVLRKISSWYLSKKRYYSYGSIRVVIYPGVFHPGFFFSTKVLLRYLTTIELEGKNILELGAGSGLIAIFCAKQGAIVTASDINKVALECIIENADVNHVSVTTKLSDLFDDLTINLFDMIIINPPYYPKKPVSIEEYAWFCGENFEYFEKLFQQLSMAKQLNVLMILSQDCDLNFIHNLARQHTLELVKVYSKKVLGEENYLFEIRKN